MNVQASFVALAIIGVLGAEPSRAAGQFAAMPDDAAVLDAIVEHSIRPEVQKASSRAKGAPLAVFRTQSSSLCRNRPVGQSECHIPEEWNRFLLPNAEGTWLGLLPDDRIRKQLVESLEARNFESQPLPIVTHPDIVRLAGEPPNDVPEEYRERVVGSCSFSLPGYTTDRQAALVYGSYGCGSLCGYSWLFVLEKVDGQWRVKSATVTAIS